MTLRRSSRRLHRSQAHSLHGRRSASPSALIGGAALVGVLLVAVAVGASHGSGSGRSSSIGAAPVNGPTSASPAPAATPTAPAAASAVPDTSAPPAPIGALSRRVRNVYAADGAGMFAPAVAGLPPRVYVPDEASGTVIVINPRTFRIVGRFTVGPKPEHVTPDWDLRRLYVEVAGGGHLTIISPTTERPIGIRTAPGPYNLYFSLDGRKAILILDSRLSGSEYSGPHQVYFYDRRTWRLLKALQIPWPGADHLDFTADGRFALLSTEYSGYVVKIDVARMAVVTALFVGGLPIDVRLAPDGRLFYVANQGLGGVSVIDPRTMRQIAFLPTGRGAHGLAVSRDARRLYVTNRLAGTLSVIDCATRRVVATWQIGGSPDMIAVSPDGRQLWISNRFSGTVSVVSTRSGRVIATIHTGGRPHGLAFFPEPGRLSLGHNGIYR